MSSVLGIVSESNDIVSTLLMVLSCDSILKDLDMIDTMMHGKIEYEEIWNRMGIMKSIRLIKSSRYLVMAFLCAFLFVERACAKEAGYDYVFGIHFDSVGGQSSSSLFDLVNMIMEIGSQETGLKIKLQKFPSHKAVAEAWVKNEIDGGLLHTGDAVWLVNSGARVLPWATFVVDKKGRAKECFWHRKSESIKTIADLSGKSLLYSIPGEFGLILMRDNLMKMGVDKPLWDVFGSFVVVPSGNSALLALAMNEGDVLWNDSDHKEFLKIISPNLVNELTFDMCSENLYSRGFLGINPAKVKEEDVQKAFDLIDYYTKNANTLVKNHPEFQAMYSYAKLAKMKFVKARPDEFDYEIKLYKKAQEKGWTKEVALIEKTLKNAKSGEKVKVKPDMEYCKQGCGKGDSDCVLSCLE